MLILRILERLVQALNVPLTVTGVLAFFGYNLDVHAVRSLLDAVLPDHFAPAFARLTGWDYLWLAGYVFLVAVYWPSGRQRTQYLRLEEWFEGSALGKAVSFALIGVGVLVALLFSLTLIYLLGDLVSPACALTESAERCADQLDWPWGLALMAGCVGFTILSTLGAALIGAVGRRQAGASAADSATSPRPN
jgi:hypothetical protein